MATIKYKIGLSNADKQQMASDVLDEVINGEIVVGEETTNIAEKVSEINGAVDTVNNKANKDGSYELMTVGLSKQLQASLGVTTTDGFTERTTAGDASVSDGVAEIKSIKGVSIRNLVANSDLLIDSDSDGVP